MDDGRAPFGTGFRGRIARTRRLLRFLRHVPLRKLGARARLLCMRRYGDRFGWRLPCTAPPPLRPRLPQPLMPARSGLLTLDERGAPIALTFLDRSERIALPGLDWGTPSPEPRDQLWRMHLHYMEYLEGVDDALFRRFVDDWIDANDPPRPGAWRDGWNSYALSIRCAVWMQQLAARAARLDPAFEARARLSLWRQLIFLTRNLETDLGGNHLVKNIKALIFAGHFFPDAGRFRERGEALLVRELRRQILSDGVHAERSPSYHAQVLVDCLDMLHAGLSPAIAADLRSRLPSMLAALADLTHPDGGPALFNDAGLSMSDAPSRIAAAAARLGLASPAEEDAPIERPQAGYFGIRRRDVTLIADCGRIGPDDLPGHAHGDVLSFELSLHGHRIVVDQGVIEYVDGERRRAARSARHHNTLSVDGLDQAEFFGAFRCGRRPNPVVDRFRRTPGGFVLEGHHDGYARTGARLVHHRRFELAGGCLDLTDDLRGADPHPPASIGVLLHPDVAIRPGPEDETRTLTLERAGVRLAIESEAPIAVEDAVWWPDLGTERRTMRLRIRPRTFPHRLSMRWR